MKENFPQFDCDKYIPGNGCKLPILPAHFGGKAGGEGTSDIHVPGWLEIPGFLKLFLKGPVKLGLSISNGEGSEIICVKTEIKLLI